MQPDAGDPESRDLLGNRAGRLVFQRRKSAEQPVQLVLPKRDRVTSERDLRARNRGGPHSANPVGDAAAVEIVWRQLDFHLVAWIDADAEAPHLATGVREGLVAVVESDPIHPGAERLEDLALE